MDIKTTSPIRTTDGTTVTAAGWLVPPNSTWRVLVLAVARQVGGGSPADMVFEQQAVVRRNGTGAPTVKATGAATKLPASSPWTVAPAIDSANNLIVVNVTGASGVTVDWNTRILAFGIAEGQVT